MTIPESQLVTLESLEIAVAALEEIGSQLAPVEDYELIQVKCAEALDEIKRKMVLNV